MACGGQQQPAPTVDTTQVVTPTIDTTQVVTPQVDTTQVVPQVDTTAVDTAATAPAPEPSTQARTVPAGN